MSFVSYTGTAQAIGTRSTQAPLGQRHIATKRIRALDLKCTKDAQTYFIFFNFLNLTNIQFLLLIFSELSHFHVLLFNFIPHSKTLTIA